MGVTMGRRGFLATAGIAALACTQTARAYAAGGVLDENYEFGWLTMTVPGQGLKTGTNVDSLVTFLAASTPFCIRLLSLTRDSMPVAEDEVVACCETILDGIEGQPFGAAEFDRKPEAHGALLTAGFSAIDSSAGLKVKGMVVPIDGTYVVVAAEWPKAAEEPAEVEGILSSVAAISPDSVSLAADGRLQGAIAWGERVATEDYDFILDGYSWEYGIYAPNSLASWLGVEAKGGNILLVVSGAITNCSSTAVDFTYATHAEFTINGKYKFEAEVDTAGVASTSFLDDVNPLECAWVKIHAEVPLSMYEQFQSAQLTWKFEKDITNYNNWDDEYGPTYVYELS